MAQKILQTSNVNTSQMRLWKRYGEMPPIGCESSDELTYWVEKLMEFEKDITKDVNPDAVLQAYRRYFAYPTKDSMMWHDFAIVLAADRVRKITGGGEEMHNMLEYLNFEGYRFNVRRKS